MKKATFVNRIIIRLNTFIMKHIFSLISLLLFSVAGLMAQPRLTSNTQEYNFGQIEWKHPVSVTYIITNSGDKPLVISNVTASCDCSTVEWTPDPIMPGEKGSIKATFDANLLGHFEKSVAVYSNSNPNLVYFSFRGEVVTELSDYTRTHPYEIGQLRVNRKDLDFGDIHEGEKTVMELEVVNQTERPYEPMLMHLPPCLKAEYIPAVILKGKRGVIRLTLDADKLDDYGATKLPLYLSRFTGDKVSKSNMIPFSVMLLPSFNHMSDMERKNAPVLQISDEKVDFTEVLRSKKKATGTVILTNRGKSTLHICRLQSDNAHFKIHLPKTVLEPGESTKLKITAFKKSSRNSSRDMEIIMITDDPARPKVSVHVKR